MTLKNLLKLQRDKSKKLQQLFKETSMLKGNAIFFACIFGAISCSTHASLYKECEIMIKDKKEAKKKFIKQHRTNFVLANSMRPSEVETKKALQKAFWTFEILKSQNPRKKLTLLGFELKNFSIKTIINDSEKKEYQLPYDKMNLLQDIMTAEKEEIKKEVEDKEEIKKIEEGSCVFL